VSKKPENVFIKRVKNANKNNYFQSIETYTTLGCADCFCVVNGSSFWLEFKHTNVKNLGLSKYQMAWQLKLIKHGGHVFNLVKVVSQRCLKTYRLEPLGVRLIATANDNVDGINQLLNQLSDIVRNCGK
jgi:penicillin-binding protein-related factor A (putative recombinase)